MVRPKIVNRNMLLVLRAVTCRRFAQFLRNSCAATRSAVVQLEDGVKPPHGAFGGGAAHFCLGNPLARLELRVLFEELMRRMPDMQIAGPVTRLTSNFSNELTSIPVTFTPGKREGTNGSAPSSE